MLEEGATSAYSVGNVLMFADKRMIGLGHELIRADDLQAAKEYLDQKGRQEIQTERDYEQQLAALNSQVVQQEAGLAELTLQISQRDELLRDLSETLTSQKLDNELLHAQLLKTREQISVGELKHDELVGDLRIASSETQIIETTLERVMEEKYLLEQELAERITDMVELNLQNDDLRKQLKGPGLSTTTQAAQQDRSAENPQQATPAHQQATPQQATPAHEWAAPQQDTRTLTMASGKQIHILHEFPAAPKVSLLSHMGHFGFTLLRIIAILAVAVLILGTASVIATAQVNGITFGSALDLILSGFQDVLG